MHVYTSLSRVGVIWSILTILLVAMSSIGFYMQHWLIGKLPNNITTEFNLFRRCHYYTLKPDNKTVEYVEGCGRYTTFKDIPDMSWQISIIMASVGICLLLFTAFLSVFACCLEYFNRLMARFCGCVQLISSLSIAGSILLFVYGLSNSEVSIVCGPPPSYFLAGSKCHFGWAYFTSIGAATGTALNSIFAFFSYQTKTREDKTEDFYM